MEQDGILFLSALNGFLAGCRLPDGCPPGNERATSLSAHPEMNDDHLRSEYSGLHLGSFMGTVRRMVVPAPDCFRDETSRRSAPRAHAFRSARGTADREAGLGSEPLGLPAIGSGDNQHPFGFQLSAEELQVG